MHVDIYGLVVMLFCLVTGGGCTGAEGVQDITIVGVNTASTWPTYIAKEGGYYEKYGLRVKLVFLSHPAGIAAVASGQAHVNLNTLQQAMQVTAKDRSFLMCGSPLGKWLFALVARPGIKDVAALKNKRIGVTQIGGATFDYALSLLRLSGVRRDQVDWVPLGDNSRAAALLSRRVDATMLSAPAYFSLEKAGFNSVANIADRNEIQSANVLLFSRKLLKHNLGLPEVLLKAHAEAVRRFYDDKAFAIEAYLRYDKQDRAGLERVYDTYANTNAFERVPYITDEAVRYVIDSAADSEVASALARADYRGLIDNGPVDRLVDNGFFEQLFGAAVRQEAATKTRRAFR